VADEPNPGKVSAQEDPRAKGWANLRPSLPGEVRNKAGTNAYVKALARLRKFAAEPDPDSAEGKARNQCVLDTWYKSCLIVGPRGAPDRKLWTEQLNGKAKMQMDISAAPGTLGGVMLVPVPASAAEWEAAAEAAQRQLKDEVRK